LLVSKMLPWKWLQLVHKNVKMLKTTGVKRVTDFRHYLASRLASGADSVALGIEDGDGKMEP
jgi:hypothetical protein